MSAALISQAGDGTDWAAVHALLTRAFAFMEGRIDPPSSLTRMGPADLARKAAGGTVLLAHDPELAGCLFASARADTLYLGKIAVDPARQGHGTGRALIDAAAGIARARGLPTLELQTRIELVENHRAFAAMGFEKVAETAHPGYTRPTSTTWRRPV
ncbi:GNAT family N-acetyltransferase [Rhodobacteraceae bacterium NNCM2]|nr:GNAT family N-acetyltransferase [Coraliihabitans acroporae]